MEGSLIFIEIFMEIEEIGEITTMISLMCKCKVIKIPAKGIEEDMYEKL